MFNCQLLPRKMNENMLAGAQHFLQKCMFAQWTLIRVLAVLLMTHCILGGHRVLCENSLQKHAYSSILKISPPKTEKFSDKNSDILYISFSKLRLLALVRTASTNNLRFWAEIRKIMYTSVNANFSIYITKTNLYNFEPLKPHFYIVKLGFTGVYNVFLISAKKHRYKRERSDTPMHPTCDPGSSPPGHF